ncbi:MAG: ATP-grasp domain-containing protein [Chloroflexi bacterium]|nr:ATP-grasp domain-containing protein [Ktedonobacteraceae bacterium]MBV9019250.1 ATP-grasp domain-containing protein [Ktedonobacteraceae bacterium]MBV9706177.1 ATP-grasp domain-containing protein [Chloroflexota bacterium]
MTTWVVFIESNTSGTGRLFIQRAADYGLKPILLTRNPTLYKSMGLEEEEVLCVDTQDEDALFEACLHLGKRGRLAGITSSSEYFVGAAACLASRFGLPALAIEVIESCRDKTRLCQYLQSVDVRVPRFQEAGSISAAIEAAQYIGFPAVLKPVIGTGSRGVKLCQNLSAVEEQATRLLRQERNERGLSEPRRILVQEMIVGSEFSVETFGDTIIGITAKHIGIPPFFVETGHDYPARLTSQSALQIEKIVRKVLHSLNYNWGPAHIELRLTEEGPVIIEVNPRLAGGYIPELVLYAQGLDLISATLIAVVGQQPQLKKERNHFASIRFLMATAEGEIVNITGIDEARALPTVVDIQIYKQAGDVVQVYGDFRDRIGHVIAAHPSSELAISCAEQAHKCIKFAYNPSNIKDSYEER